MNGADPLAQLRDIHLPDPIGWYPPAFGWWLLAIIIMAILVMSTNFLLRYLRQNRYRKSALNELGRLKDNQQDHSSRYNLEQLAMLLRRVAIQTSGRKVIAPLIGLDWLQFLDNKGKTNQFTSGPGKVLGQGLYQQSVEADLEQLFQLVEKWIRRSRQC